MNHRKTFKDPITGAHTNTIERQWREVRAHVPCYGKTQPHFHQYLAEFQFKRKVPCFTNRIHEFFLTAATLNNPHGSTASQQRWYTRKDT